MTLCNSCMDDATRQRLQRDGFGAFTVYYSAARASANPVTTTNSDDMGVSKRRRMWGNATTAAAAAVVVVGRAHLLAPVESGTGTTTSTSIGSRSPRESTSADAGVRQRNGSINVCADIEMHRIRFLSPNAAVGDGPTRRQLLGDRLAVPCRQTSAARRSSDGSNLIEPEVSSTGLWSESADIEL